MKGGVTTETIGLIAVVLAVMSFFALILPKILSSVIETLSKASGENVARRLAGLISISASAPSEANISYQPTDKIKFDLKFYKRTVKVTPKAKVAYAEKTSGIQPFLINLPDREYKDVNLFLIKKSGERYEFKAE